MAQGTSGNLFFGEVFTYYSYDMQFAMQGLYERGGRAPKITNNGLKLMQIELRGTNTTCHVVFRDSCLLFPMKLDDIPETFSVTDKVSTPAYTCDTLASPLGTPKAVLSVQGK
jgi:hypothetical protein